MRSRCRPPPPSAPFPAVPVRPGRKCARCCSITRRHGWRGLRFRSVLRGSSGRSGLPACSADHPGRKCARCCSITRRHGWRGLRWREGSGVQPATGRFRSRVRVGVAGPGRRPSARHSALFPSGARRSGAASSGPGVLGCWSIGVLEYWTTGVLENWGTGVLGPHCSLSPIGQRPGYMVLVGERAVGFTPQQNGSEVGGALG